jgi:hypothetical protein
MGLGVKVAVRAVDKGWGELRKAAKAIKEGGSYVKVGVLGEGPKNERPGDTLDNVGLALIHEFGAPIAGIPERSFIRSSFEANRPAYVAALRKMVEQVYELKMAVPKGLGLIGAKMAADMKQRMVDPGIPPPNAPSVYARKLAKGSGKGEPKALIDTGRLRGSITWQVVVQGSPVSGGFLADQLEKLGGGE